MSTKQDKEALIQEIVAAIQDLKGEDIQILDMTGIENAVADYFVICSGNSNTQVNALGGKIEKEVRNNLQDRPFHTEGYSNSEWVLLDYINVVVHIFQKNIREYYDIEGLWGDAKVTKIANLD